MDTTLLTPTLRRPTSPPVPAPTGARPSATAVAAPAAPAVGDAAIRAGTLHLAPGATWSGHCRAGSRWHVDAGRVWLTQTGDGQDHFLAAGQCWIAARHGRVVLEAEGPMAAVLRPETPR